MKRIMVCIALFLACASGAPAPAQEQELVGAAASGPAQRRWGEGRAFELLLERRDELDLSPDQVERLQAIARLLEAANRPLRERLAAERERFLAERRAQLERMSPGERRAERERMRRRGRPPLPSAMRPVAEAMRRNIHEAMRQAHAVLTPEQRAQVRRMMEHARERRGTRVHRRPGGHAAPR